MTEYRLIQDGQPVAGVIGPTPPALREIIHYAAVYSQDGLVQVQIKTELGGWVDVQS